MPIKTNLNISPYFDDFDKTKDYYRILFQPGVSVQTRELNQLQTMFQQQVERFGDNIFSAGTIVSGCNFSFNNPYPYIKIRDLTFDGTTAIPFGYVNFNIINDTTGLTAWITNYADGFESTDPNLKTLYVNYTNTGNSSITITAFNAGDVLRVFDPVQNGIEQVNIINGGVGFANTDTPIAISPFLITVATGSFNVGDFIINNQGANVQITALDANTYANAGQILVQTKPRNLDLANSSLSSANWSFITGQSITNISNTASAVINNIIGTGFRGAITTDGVGVIKTIKVLSKGTGWTGSLAPYITTISLNNTTGFSSLNLQAQTYKTKVVVASTPSSVGNGYAFTITEGVIYQKGVFLRAVPQSIIVSKYSQTPDNVAVGFITNEQIINYNIDQTLLDNANNQLNFQAPGADRLKLIPTLNLTDANTAATNSEFLTLVQWKEGRPFKQNQSTVYSILGDTMALRTSEQSGNFVIDPFLITTRSPLVTTNEGSLFNVLIDPGKAYIEGYRISSTSNFNIDDAKGTDTVVANSHIISLNYGNYTVINNLGGTFQFNIGDTVNLYDTARGFLANTALIRAQTLIPPGNVIGTANMRSLLRQDNSGGTSAATYRLYLFNIKMNVGKNFFRDTKAVYYNGTNKGVADIVTVVTPISTGNTTVTANVAQLSNTIYDRLTFDSGVDTIFNANNCNYTYRTIDSTVTISNGNIANGTLIKDISGNPNEVFPYTGGGALSSTQMLDIFVTPVSGEMVATTAAPGTVVANTTTTNVVGTTTTFLTNFVVGDWVYVGANSTGGADLHQVSSIVNNTFLSIDSNNAFTNAVATLTRAFPQNVPIPFGQRSGLNANVNLSQTALTLDFGMPFTFSGTRTASLAVNINRSAVNQLTKSPLRNRFVMINTSNNAGGLIGPWAIGVPDVFRLNGVYVGNSTVSNTTGNQVKNFFVDHNQNADFYDLSWLYMIPQSSVSLAANTFILVQFDYFQSSGPGFYDTVSYTQTTNSATLFIQDSQPLSNLASVINSFEIPEMFTDDEKKFPLPDSAFTTNMTYWIGRMDSIFVDKNTNFSVVRGIASQFKEKQAIPVTPPGAIKLIDLIIPPYPNLPTYYSTQINQILNTRVLNQKWLTTRVKNKTISAPTANTVLPYNQPKVYTMSDIGNIDRRLKDVEYYTSLTALEAGLNHKFIASSFNPTQNRFKFGFFVDDFTTSTYSDLTNPQYWALKEGSDIVPPKMTWDVSLSGGYPDFIDSIIIAQAIATVGGVDDPLGLGPICALNLANTVAYQTFFRNASDVLKSANPTSVSDTVNLQLADQATVFNTVNFITQPLAAWLATHQYQQISGDVFVNDPNFLAYYGGGFTGVSSFSDLIGAVNSILASVYSGGTLGPDAGLHVLQEGFSIGSTYGGQFNDLYNYLIAILQNAANNLTISKPAGGQFAAQIYYPPVVVYFYNYDRPNLIQIYQNGTLVADTNSAQTLTADDINLLTGPGGQQWFNDNTQFFLKPFQSTGGGYTTYAGKITFNYNPTNGQNFKIVATSPTSIRWRYVVAYPIDGKSVGCVPPTPIYNIPPTFTAQYQTVGLVAWCGNAYAVDAGSVNILSGYTETWNPYAVPAPTVSVVPFNIAQDWYQGPRKT